MHRRAVLAVDALQSKMQACQDEKEFLALLITYENVYSHMNDTTTNSENLLLSHKHKWIFNFVTKIEIYLKELLQEIYEFRHKFISQLWIKIFVTQLCLFCFASDGLNFSFLRGRNKISRLEAF